MSDPVFIVWAAFLGASIGSFLNVCIARLPVGESVVRPRSRCASCGEPIHARDNIPVLSWLLLRGRCRSCREPISWQYPAVELATMAVWIGMAVAFGPTPRGLVGAILFSLLLAIALTDARH